MAGKTKHIGKTRIFISVFILVFLLSIVEIPGAINSTAFAYSDPNCISDEDFFGVWNGSSWTTVGKINYNYSASLSSVENAVKAGNYSTAKTELLNYYQNRSTKTVIPYADSERNTLSATMTGLDRIFYCSGFLGTFEVNEVDSYSSFIVTETVQDAMANDEVGFMLRGMYKTGVPVEFNSRENASNNPKLEVVVNGNTIVLDATYDTYVRAGTYGDDNYGDDDVLVIKDSGVPTDDYYRQVYIKFDLSSLSAEPTSADLKLYGSRTTGTGNYEIAVFKHSNLTTDEDEITWNNFITSIFSWNGVAAGFDWNKPDTSSSEWLNGLTRFAYLGQMTQEYVITDNENWANNAIGLMVDFIYDKGNDGGYPRSLEAGIRSYNWVRAYHYLVDSTYMDSAANSAILKYIWKMGEYLQNNFSDDSNWGISQTQGFYSIATYFPEFTISSQWFDTANSRLSYMISNLVYPDKSYIEATTLYTKVVVDTFNIIKQFGEINSESFEDSYDNDLEGLARYLMDSALPDGFDPSYGDSDTSDFRPSILSVGDNFSNSEMIYFGSDGSSGSEPTRESILYPDSKNVFMRTGWDDNDLYIHFNNGIGNHGHPDNLAINLYGYGKRLLTDQGRFTYSESEIGDWIRTTTEAHNTIEINDSAQEQNNNLGVIDKWATGSLYDFCEGTSTAYSDFEHLRSVLFIKPYYCIVSDYVSSISGTNDYKQTWHVLPDSGATIDATTKKLETDFSGEANIQVVPADSGSITATLDSGWYSTSYGTLYSTNYASYSKDNITGDVTFDTVLYPTESSDTSRDVKITRLTTNPSVGTTVATSLEIDLDYGNNGNEGYYYLSHEENPTTARSFDDFNYNGKVAYIEKTYQDVLESAFIGWGTILKQNSTDIINSPTLVKDIGVKWDSSNLEISGSELTADTDTNTAIAIYAPSFPSTGGTVKLNGTTISYTKSGDYVYAVTAIKYSSSGFTSVYDLGRGDTGSLTLEFDVTPLASGIDGVMGISDSSTIPEAWTSFPMVVRMNTSGYFDVRNGSTYTSDQSVAYSPNTTYHVRVISYTQSKLYSVWITPDGGAQTQIAQGYSFRTDGEFIDDVGKLTLVSSQSDKQFYLESLSADPYFYYSDDFEDGDSNGWGSSGGTWSVVTDDSKVYKQTDKSGSALSYAGSSAWTDYVISSKVKLYDKDSSSVSAGIIARYVNSTNYYSLILQGGKLKLYKTIDGTAILLQDDVVDYSTNEWYVLKFVVCGNSLKGYFNDLQILSVSDSSLSTGKVALITYQQTVAFDEVKIR